MKYTVIVSLEFKKDFYKLPNNIQGMVRKILKKLEVLPKSGIPLKHDLNGFYSYHFEKNKYRLIYRLEETIVTVLALHVGKRTDRFYDELRELVKKIDLKAVSRDKLTSSDLK